jgi:hypothetical protein
LIISQAALAWLEEMTMQIHLHKALTTDRKGYLKNIRDEHTKYANLKAIKAEASNYQNIKFCTLKTTH